MTETASAIKQTDSRSLAFVAANIAESKKAHATLILDIRTVSILADYFVITGGQTSTQVRAIADGIDQSLAELGMNLKSIEGKKEGLWILMDYEDIIVHIMQEKERNYYNLEQFWGHSIKVDRNEWLKDIE